MVLLFAPASRAADPLTEVAFLAVALLPASLAYAVLKHRVMGIRVVVRRGVQYLLARNVLRVALAVPSLVLLYRLVVLRHQTVAEVLFSRPGMVVAVVVAGLSLRYRRPLLEEIDRRFFRQSYVQEQVLLRLIDEVRRQPTLDGLARLLTEQLDAALHPSSVTVLLSREVRGDLETAYSSTGAAERTPITRGRPLLQRLGGSFEPCEVDERLHGQLDPEESPWLTEHQAALLVPLAGSEGEIVGLLALGEKRSEEPYSPTDRRLLQALGTQAAITAENLLLRDRVTREAGIRRDVLERLESEKLPLLRECPRCGACSDGDGNCEVDGAELVLTLPIERILDRRYRLDRRIGQGGMASVFQAWDLRLSRPVAAKVLMGRYFGDAVVLRRFAREARAIAALSHPNIVGVHDSGTCGPDGAYLVLELVEGQTLREVIRDRAPLPPRLAADFLDPLLQGLGAAHQAGLVHRDIKPSNVLVGGDLAGPVVVKLGDFGIAKLRFDDEDPGTVLTETGALVGTVRYMAPEQLSGGEVDRRADLWAVGLIAVELLTGQHPFAGREPGQILAAACGPPLRLAGNEQATRVLEGVLRRCLAPRPEDRFATADELRTALLAALGDCADEVKLATDGEGAGAPDGRLDHPSTLLG